MERQIRSIHANDLKQFANTIKIIFLVLIGLWFVLSSFYTVQPDEIAIVFRFGKDTGLYGPGLHWKVPFGVDKVTKVKLTKIRAEDFGFRTKKAGVRTVYSRANYDYESYMLTGDLNIAEVKWTVQYRVIDPKKYIFNIRNKKKNIRDVSEAITRLVVGNRSIDEVLTIGRSQIEDEVKRKMQEILNRYQMGVEITLVKLQNVAPPRPVAPSFNEVNEARQEKARIINEAIAEYDKTATELAGEARQIISEAKGYSEQKKNTAKGDVAKFKEMLKEYEKAKSITKKRLYLETMNEIYKKSGRKIIIDEDLKSVLPLLDLEKISR